MGGCEEDRQGQVTNSGSVIAKLIAKLSQKSDLVNVPTGDINPFVFSIQWQRGDMWKRNRQHHFI